MCENIISFGKVLDKIINLETLEILDIPNSNHSDIIVQDKDLGQ